MVRVYVTVHECEWAPSCGVVLRSVVTASGGSMQPDLTPPLPGDGRRTQLAVTYVPGGSVEIATCVWV